MKKRVTASLIAITAAVTCAAVMGTGAFAAVSPEYLTPAFPTAEGAAKYTVNGAREKIENGAKTDVEVYHVTNLNDDGAGSFRDAVSRGDRMIVFDVSGMIDLKSRVSITHDNITILGQTAPGDGICFRGNSVKINGSNIIVRYLRFRPGSKLADGSDTETQDGFSIPIGAKNVILDHCSISWGTDENLSIIGGDNVTVQRCIISEALNSSIHDKGEHSYAGIWGGINVCMHHNIIASHKSRNPKIGTSETVSMTAGHPDSDTVVDMWNNVFYNWGDKAGYGAENGANVNIVNNYYKPGPATPDNKRARIFELSAGNKYQKNWSGDIYASGNFIDDDGADAAAVNADNWQIEKGTGVYIASSGITYNKLDELPSASNLKYIFSPYGLIEKLQTAEEAYEDVLSDVGAARPKQDLVDARIIENVTNRTAPERGSHGSSYLVDDPVDAIPEGQEALYDERGYPIWESETRAADFDADGDGIADAWEDKMGLDRTNPNDALNRGANGYTWLEIYGESCIADNTVNTPVSVTNDGNKYTLTVNSGAAVKTEFYYENGKIGEAEADGNTGSELDGVKNGDLVIKAAYENHALTEVKAAVYGDNFVMPEVSGSNTRVFVWDSFEGMQPVGSSSVSSMETELASGMYKISAKLIYADGSYKITPSVSVTVKDNTAEPQTVSGDFEIVGNISDVPNFVSNAYAGVYADDFVVAAGCNSEFKPVIKYGKKSNGTFSEKDNKGYKYVKISVKNGHADLYAASTIGLWDKLSDNGYDYKGTDKTAGKYIINPDNKEYEASIWRKVITDFTAPSLAVNNIEDKTVLSFNDNVNVTVNPDDYPKDVIVLFNGEIIASKMADDPFTFDIPVSFNGAQEGTLTVLCYNDNFQSTSKSYNVYVSADYSPWEITDVSADGNKDRTYMYATEDYTFKIGGMDGNIGEDSDTFGYVYQKFSGNNRIYYRSRMQDAKQFGIMFRESLNPQSPAVYFGGEKDGDDIKYVLKTRGAEGEVMDEEIIEDLSGSNLYFIAEYKDGNINIYQTENTNETVYKTKKLIKSVPALPYDNYYMGFASVSDGTGNIPDCGWLGLDGNTGDSVFNSTFDWSFENGLDWCWQIQERNVLKPEWVREKLSEERKTGAMLLAPDDNYTGERYVFREYTMEDGYDTDMTTRVMLTGEEPAMNIYLQTGDANTAYKLTFDMDNKIKDADGNEIGEWEAGALYTVFMKVRVNTDTLENECKLIVNRKGSSHEVVDNVTIPLDGNFRTQNNVSKTKTPVTKAVYFEPIAAANGKYYIEDAAVNAVEQEVKVVKTEKLYTFEKPESYEGLAISGVSAEALSKAKNVAGVNFTGKVRLSKAAHTLTIPVTGDCEIKIYATSANKDETRYLVLNDGESHDLGFDTNGYMTVGGAAVYKYKGGERDIVISAKSGVDVYGIEITTKRLEPAE